MRASSTSRPRISFPLACPWRTRADWHSSSGRRDGTRWSWRTTTTASSASAAGPSRHCRRSTGTDASSTWAPFRRRCCRGCGWASSSRRLRSGTPCGRRATWRDGTRRCLRRRPSRRSSKTACSRVICARRAARTPHATCESCGHWSASSPAGSRRCRRSRGCISPPASGSEASGSRLKSPSGRAPRRSPSTAFPRTVQRPPGRPE